MLGVIFLSFSFQMYADRIVLFEYFLFGNESLWTYILCLKVPSIAPMLYFVEWFFFTMALYTTFLLQFPCKEHVDLFL